MRIFQGLFFFLFFNYSSAQLIGEGDYKIFSKKLTKIGQHNLKDKENNCTQRIKYLGKIISTDKQTFKVLTSHKNLSGKGVNDLVFISANSKEYIYRLNLPSDFPIYISNNRLFFKNERKLNVSMTVDTLTDEFCTPIECFTKI